MLEEWCKLYGLRPKVPDGTTQKNSAIRWLRIASPWSIEDPWPAGPLDLPDALDIFIDRHLWFLPIPRYNQVLPETHMVDEITIWAALLEVSNRLSGCPSVDLDGPSADRRLLATAAHGFGALVPLVNKLRESQTQEHVAAIIVALLALDLRWCRTVDSKFVGNLNAWATPWASSSLRSVLSTCGPFALVEGLQCNEDIVPSDYWPLMLQRVDSQIQKWRLQEAIQELPIAAPEWLSLADAKNMFPDEGTEILIGQAIDDWADTVGLRPETLAQWAYIKDLAEEVPQIGFRPIWSHNL